MTTRNVQEGSFVQAGQSCSARDARCLDHREFEAVDRAPGQKVEITVDALTPTSD